MNKKIGNNNNKNIATIKDTKNNLKDENLSDFGNLDEMFGKFAKIMEQINDPSVDESKAEEIFSSALCDIQQMNEKFKTNVDSSMKNIMGNKDVPDDFKKMLSNIKGDLDKTVNQMNSEDENIDPQDLQKTSKNLMDTLQNLMTKTISNEKDSDNDNETSSILSALNEIKKDINGMKKNFDKNFSEIKDDICGLEKKISIHEKIIRQLSEK